MQLSTISAGAAYGVPGNPPVLVSRNFSSAVDCPDNDDDDVILVCRGEDVQFIGGLRYDTTCRELNSSFK